MKKNLVKSVIFLLLLNFFIVLPSITLAQLEPLVEPIPTNTPAASSVESPLLGKLKIVADRGGYNTDPAVASSARIIGRVVGAFIGFTGLVFIILIIIGGYTWMTASGNEEKIKKATATIKTAIIGLIVSLSAYTLWTFIFQRLIQ